MLKLHLREQYFTEKEHLFLEYKDLRVYLFRYSSSVAAIRVTNRRGEIVVLPYQGQQIWRCRFDGREMTMKSIFDEPVCTQDYLKTYGGFFLHCGATAFGVPSMEDTHPLHGELPNAPYQESFISCGKDIKGYFISISGRYTHKVAFNHHYKAEPEIKLYEDTNVLDVSMKITNLLKTSMDVMYMGHINFRPVDYAELVYSAHYDSEHVRVNVNVPEHIKTNIPIGQFINFLNQLKENPILHHKIDPEALFDPEVVINISYLAGEDGWAHSLQIHPDGKADYVGHRIDQMDQALRWIARNPDQDAMGLVLPANSGNNGYLAEKAAGRVKSIKGGETICIELLIGQLDTFEVAEVKQKIEKIRGDKT